MIINLDSARLLTPRTPTPAGPIIGVDVGQRRDWTALAILSGLTLVGLDRTRQEDYNDVVEKVAGLLDRPELAEATVVLDETGVGIAVGDLMAKALKAKGKAKCLMRVTMTAGLMTTPVDGGFHVPKKDLVTATAVAMEGGQLKIPNALPLAGKLVEELGNFQVKIAANGHVSYGAAADWREGNHDDLVLAVALACWYRDRRRPNRGAWSC